MRRAVVVIALAACGTARKEPVALVNVTPLALPSSTPAPPPSTSPTPNEPHLQIVAGFHFCARVEGRVYCSPLDEVEQPIVQEKHAIAGIDDATQLVAGQGTMCVTTRRGTVQCWGDNSWGQLGAHIRAERSDAPVEVIGLTHVRRLAAGRWHFCASLEDGGVRCWGRNDSGQTGSDTAYLPEARELVEATEVPGVNADVVAAAYSFTCARTPTREVTCWGATQDAQRAIATGKRTERPTLVADVADIESLSAGESTVCGVQRRGTVVCWAEGRRLVAGFSHGKRGPGFETVDGISNAVRVATWDDHACALLADGRVSCFGYPYSGALGTAVDENTYEAVPAAIVEGVTRATSVSVASGISCALTRDDEVFCWGRWYSEHGSHAEPKPKRIQLR